jgi:hypothetical protein
MEVERDREREREYEYEWECIKQIGFCLFVFYKVNPGAIHTSLTRNTRIQRRGIEVSAETCI